MPMKMKDVFEVENAIVNGCKTKHWILLKALDKNLKKCREHADVARKALEPTEALKTYMQEQERVQAENAHETAEVQSAKIRDLKAKHPGALEEFFGRKKLEVEILEDAVDVEWEPIPEALFHDGGVCRVEADAYMVLSRWGVVKE
jgi:predicted nuclease with TOPRIM domain